MPGRAITVGPAEGATSEGPAGGPLTFEVRGVPHCFKNVGSERARILLTFTPAGMARFFDRLAELPEFDPKAFGAMGSEVGMRVVGPPLS